MNHLRIVAASGLLLACAALGGCFGYANYPPVAGSQWDTNDPNTPGTEGAMQEALRWVIVRYPPPESVGGAFAINLPPGTRRKVYENIARELGPGASPMSPEVRDLPTYHVSHFRTRGPNATVDVLRPVFELDPAARQGVVWGADGRTTYQCVTVYLKGGFEPWRVEGTRIRDVAVVAVPEPNDIPEVDAPYRVMRREAAAGDAGGVAGGDSGGGSGGGGVRE